MIYLNLLKAMLLSLLLCWAAAGCSHLPSGAGSVDIAASAAELKAENWVLQNLPTKKNTIFSFAQDKDLRIRVVQAQANASASLLRRKLHIEPTELNQLFFSWKVPQLVAAADMATREAEDAPVRVLLLFEGDRNKFSAKNKMLSELSLALTGEELPYATLMYVWCNTRPVGEVITNPRTDRIRKLVVESGEKNLGKWLDYERDIRADFIKAFGEEPGALTGVALMTDTDNTQTKATAWYGPVSFKPRAAVAVTK